MRMVLGLTVGVVVAVLVVAVCETLGHLLFPPPADVDMTNPEDMRGVMDRIPLGAKIAVLVAWAAGSLFGGWIAARVTGKGWTAWAIAGAMLLAGAATMLQIPHPLWMMIASVPAALAPGFIAARFGPKAHSA